MYAWPLTRTQGSACRSLITADDNCKLWLGCHLGNCSGLAVYAAPSIGGVLVCMQGCTRPVSKACDWVAYHSDAGSVRLSCWRSQRWRQCSVISSVVMGATVSRCDAATTSNQLPTGVAGLSQVQLDAIKANARPDRINSAPTHRAIRSMSTHHAAKHGCSSAREHLS